MVIVHSLSYGINKIKGSGHFPFKLPWFSVKEWIYFSSFFQLCRDHKLHRHICFSQLIAISFCTIELQYHFVRAKNDKKPLLCRNSANLAFLPVLELLQQRNWESITPCSPCLDSTPRKNWSNFSKSCILLSALTTQGIELTGQNISLYSTMLCGIAQPAQSVINVKLMYQMKAFALLMSETQLSARTAVSKRIQYTFL